MKYKILITGKISKEPWFGYTEEDILLILNGQIQSNQILSVYTWKQLLKKLRIYKALKGRTCLKNKNL